MKRQAGCSINQLGGRLPVTAGQQAAGPLQQGHQCSRSESASCLSSVYIWCNHYYYILYFSMDANLYIQEKIVLMQIVCIGVGVGPYATYKAANPLNSV